MKKNALFLISIAVFCMPNLLGCHNGNERNDESSLISESGSDNFYYKPSLHSPPFDKITPYDGCSVTDLKTAAHLKKLSDPYLKKELNIQNIDMLNLTMISNCKDQYIIEYQALSSFTHGPHTFTIFINKENPKKITLVRPE